VLFKQQLFCWCGCCCSSTAEDPDAITVAAHLVQNSGVGRTFNALLAKYLTQHKLQLLANHSNKVRLGLLRCEDVLLLVFCEDVPANRVISM
jgi:hypothetical protein